MPMAETTSLLLPPPYTQHRLEEGDVLAEAVRRAPSEGAGTLIWRQSGGVFGLAVVLEPEEPLATARMAFFAGMAALADALAANCPPERLVRFDYPDGILYDKARLGVGRFAVPDDCAADEVPEWMVFAGELIADRDHLFDPGNFPESTSLKEEDFEEPAAILESFASYLMLYFDRWAHQGLGAVKEWYLARIDPPMLNGQRLLDENGDLIERGTGGAERRISLDEALAASRWRDGEGPRL